jgi:ABC-type thiamine transport system substrate-binding protein
VVKGAKLHEAFETLHRPKSMMLMDGKEVEEKRKAIIDEWLEAIRK